jgi:hypothetical protein
VVNTGDLLLGRVALARWAPVRLLSVPTLPGQDLPEILRHDHDAAGPSAFEALLEPFRITAALLAARTARRFRHRDAS